MFWSLLTGRQAPSVFSHLGSHHPHSALVSRTTRRADATESLPASARVLALAPETESTNTASPGSNTGRRAGTKVTESAAAAAAARPGSPRIKTGAGSDEGTSWHYFDSDLCLKIN